ncbi:MAG: ferric reductase-like transmembrane domain-containing protein, partial [Pseudomonadota bacterium]
MRARAVAIWGALALLIGIPLSAAATSPLLAWRDAVYIAAGFAGVLALALLLVQPLLAGGLLPGLVGAAGKRAHRWVGAAVVLTVAAHVIGLWITSPPDVVDVFLFRSPTPFSIWGVIALYAVLATACLAAMRRRLRLRPRTWRLSHGALVVIIVGCTLPHALLIE